MLPTLNGCTVYIIGAGPTGRRVAQFCLSQGARIKISDAADQREALSALVGDVNLESTFGDHPERFVDQSELIIVSSGIPPQLAILEYAKKKRKRIVPALEFVLSRISEKKVIVTGSFGKTTFMNTLRAVLDSCGSDVFVTNRSAQINYAAALDRPDCNKYFFELSVAELKNVTSLMADTLCITNLSPHNPHTKNDSFSHYVSDKFSWMLGCRKPMRIYACEEDINLISMCLGEGVFKEKHISLHVLHENSARPEYFVTMIEALLNEIFPDKVSQFPRELISEKLMSVVRAACRVHKSGGNTLVSVGPFKGVKTLIWTARLLYRESVVVVPEAMASELSDDDAGDITVISDSEFYQLFNALERPIVTYDGVIESLDSQRCTARP